MKTMKLVLDTHTHSIASGHAYSTIQEMAHAASEKELELLGISEHAPAMEGTCNDMYFRNVKSIPDTMYGVEMLFGIEANIMDYEGNTDVSTRTFECLDYGIASLHVNCIKPGSIEENTNAYLRAMENPYINIIGHPDDSRFEIDYQQLVEKAKETNTLLEINNTSLSPNTLRRNSKNNYYEMLALCAQNEVPIIVNSDAHISYDVGNFQYAIPLLEEMDFPEKLIANLSVERFKSLLSRRPRP